MSAYSHEYKLRNEDLLWQTVERGDAYIPNFPPRLTFETSKRCNLACRMCYHFSTRFIQGRSTMDQPYMDLRLIEKVAEELFPTLQYYETTLLGDPFLAPYLDDELRLAGQYNVYMRPTTNGTTVTEKNIAKVNGRMDWLKCSFDSHIRGIYNAIRIGAEYETTIKRLKTFNRLREQMDPVPYFRMGLVLSDMNVDDLADYVAWCHEEMGVDDVEIMGINIDAPHVEPMALFDKAERVNRNLDAAVDLAINKKYKLRLDFTRMPYPGSGRFVCQERSAELLDIQKDFGFQPPRLFDRMSYVIRNPRNRHEIGDVGQVWSNNMRRMDRCLEFFNRPFVLDNGNIEGCGNCDTFLLGNLKRQNFSDIWNNDLYMDIRRKMFKGRIKEKLVRAVQRLHLHGRHLRSRPLRSPKPVLLSHLHARKRRRREDRGGAVAPADRLGERDPARQIQAADRRFRRLRTVQSERRGNLPVRPAGAQEGARSPGPPGGEQGRRLDAVGDRRPSLRQGAVHERRGVGHVPGRSWILQFPRRRRIVRRRQTRSDGFSTTRPATAEKSCSKSCLTTKWW